jgi:hypothetical protein
MKDNPTSMKIPSKFKSLIKRATINHAYIKKLEEPISQSNMLLRLERYFKLNDDIYIQFINMEDQNA